MVNRVVGLVALAGMVGCVPGPGSVPEIMGGRGLLPGDPGFDSTVGLVHGEDEPPYCTGVLVAADAVVTAAHCVAEEPEMVHFQAAGAPALRSVVEVKRFLAEPLAMAWFRPNFDVALVRFAGGVPTGFAPADILANPDELAAGEPLWLVGYGRTDTERYPRERSITETQVHAYVDRPHARAMLLFGRTPGRSACYGDSGGPAFVRRADGRWVVAGITRGDSRELDLFPEDWEYEDCTSGFGLYTALGPYLSWLRAELAGVPGKAEFSFEEVASPHSSFMDWCEDPHPSRGSYLTTSVLLAQEQTTRCEVAAEKLLRREELQLSVRNSLAARAIQLPDGVRLPLTDVRPLAALPHLRRVWFGDGDLESLETVGSLHQVEELRISAMPGMDFSPLSALGNLKKLTIDNLSEGEVTGLDGLRSLTHLTLRVRHGSRGARLSLSTLARLANLRELTLEGVEPAEWQALGTFRSRLEALRIRDVAVGNLTVLDGFSGSLERLALDRVGSPDVRPLTVLTRLRELSLVRDNIGDLTPFAPLKRLESLDLSDNPIPYPALCPVPEHLRRVCRFHALTNRSQLIAGDLSHRFRTLAQCTLEGGDLLLRWNLTRSEELSAQAGQRHLVLEAGRQGGLLFVGTLQEIPPAGSQEWTMMLVAGELRQPRDDGRALETQVHEVRLGSSLQFLNTEGTQILRLENCSLMSEAIEAAWEGLR